MSTWPRSGRGTWRPRERTKRRILDEVVAVTGYHRKAALRRLHRPPRRDAAGRPARAAARVRGGRRRRRSGALGRQRRDRGRAPAALRPGVAGSPDRLRGRAAAPETDAALRRVSARHPQAPARARPGRAPPARRAGSRAPGTWLKHQIPVRTFADWDDAHPGFLEGDLVAHCGPSTLGFYLCTLCAVDIVTSWTELEPVWGKGQERVGSAIHHARHRLPMPLLGWDSDSGSEFINELVLALLPAGGHHLHPRAGLSEERRRARRAEERRHRPSLGSAMIATPPRPPTRPSAWCIVSCGCT